MNDDAPEALLLKQFLKFAVDICEGPIFPYSSQVNHNPLVGICS